MNPKVDFYFKQDTQWLEEIKHLRSIILDCQLIEKLKWGCPCYTFNGANIVLIHVFKEYCAVLFFKGSLINDKHGFLIQQTENVQVPRQMRFTSLNDVKQRKEILQEYVFAAVEIEEKGIKAEKKTTAEFNIPDEFRLKLDENPDLKIAFEALTPGRQRGYLLHFSQPKQSKTRESRIEKAMVAIFEGKGLND